MGADAFVVAVLRDTDGHHLAGAVRTGNKFMLREFFQPTPLRVRNRTCAVTGLTGTEGEEIADFVQQCGIFVAHSLRGQGVRVRHDHRFAVQTEPQIGIKSGFVEILIERAEHRGSGGSGTEIEHKSNLRCAHTVLPHSAHFGKERFIGNPPEQGTVGAVKEEEIYPCVGK